MKQISLLFCMVLAVGNCFAQNDEVDPRIFIKTEIPAKFRGGDTAWANYLRDNQKSDIPAMKGAPKATYRVLVRFIVNIDSSVMDVKADTKHGFGMEAEAVRLIKGSRAWIPCRQNGRSVNCYHKQEIVFIVP